MKNRYLDTETPRTWLWVVAWLLLGVLLRVAVALPAHRYPADADCVGVGLTALRVLRGETPVFLSGVRLGSLPSHLAALLFAVFGASRTTLALAPVIASCFFLGLAHLLYRQLLGPRLALHALPFVAVPAPAVMFWTYMPNGYAETLALCALTLLLAAQVAQGKDGRWRLLALGVAAGLGWWNNLMTISCTAPAFLWLAWCRWRLVRSPIFVAVVGGGFVLGALPWIAFNLRYSLSSLTANFATRSVDETTAMLDNVSFVLGHRLPELIATVNPRNGSRADSAIVDWLQAPVLWLYAAAALYFVWRTFVDARQQAAERRSPRLDLFFGVALVVMALNVISEAGARRGLTVRYVLPLYLLVPAALALGSEQLWRRSRLVAAALAGVVLTFNLSSLHLPGSEARRQWQAQAVEDAQLVDWLRQQGVDRVAGAYWHTYSLNFLSHQEIVAIPLDALIDDYFEVTRRQATGEGYRWALVDVRPQLLAAWAERAGVIGTSHRIGRYTAFVLHPRSHAGVSDEIFMKRLRVAFAEAAQLAQPSRAPANV